MPIASRDLLSRLPFALFSGVLLLSPQQAQADIYHAVIAGETLNGIAAKYRVTPAQIRALNALSEADSTPLGAMLLRVPENKNAASATSTFATSALATSALATSTPTTSPVTTSVPVAGASTFTRSAPISTNSGQGSGVIARTLLETVRPGDTWDAIAARYQQAGHDVSSMELQKRNNFQPLPVAGQTVVVPLGQVAYSLPSRPNGMAPRIDTGAKSFPAQDATVIASNPIVPRVSSAAQTVPSSGVPGYSEPRALGGGVYASSELDLGLTQSKAKTPVARDKTPTSGPVFGATNGANFAGNRGQLPSRGGYGQLARLNQGGEVQVVQPGQDVAAPPAPRSTTTVTAPRSNTIARVARVKSAGAQIRRLPMSSAVTLYRCAAGTQLAVLRQENGWSAVLMSDRSTGWMPSRYLNLTEQSVDVSIPANTGDGPGGSAAWSVGRYRTSSPYVAHALTWLGTRYVYGGTTRRGIDCSALVMNSFATNGVRLPRTAAQQARVGTAVAPANLRPGDRLYFSASGTRIDHTGLYMGDGLFVHASGSGRSVIVSNLYTPRNWNIFVGARR